LIQRYSACNNVAVKQTLHTIIDRKSSIIGFRKNEYFVNHIVLLVNKEIVTRENQELEIPGWKIAESVC